MTENAIAKEIVDAAFRIHTKLGPGLLESVYDRSWRTNWPEGSPHGTPAADPGGL